MDIKDKVAVITGGASGIGLATAKKFAAHGAQLVLADIEEGPLALVVTELRAGGVEVVGAHCDVRREDDVLNLRDVAVNEFGTAHIVFNNAGVAAGSAIGTSKKVWDWVMDVNVGGVINGMNAFLPLLLEQNEGHIINTASLAGLGGVPGMAAGVAGAVLATAAAGFVFTWLRRRSGSLIAPIALHWSLNGLGALAAALVWQLSG